MTTSPILDSFDFNPSSQDVILFTFILCRVTGMFVISPLLTARNIGGMIRMFLSMFISLLVLMTLYKYYHGAHPLFATRSMIDNEGSWMFLTLIAVKELGIGYLLGFCFTLIFEATLLAGSLIDAMTGFATAESYDPLSNPGHTFLSPIFSLMALLIALSLDLHHQFIQVLSESFLAIPFGDYNMPVDALNTLVAGTGELFDFGLQLATIPFLCLGLGIIGVGFVARIVPEFNPLLMGLPMRILIALWAMTLAASHIPPIIKDGFIAFNALSRSLVNLIK